MKSDLHLGDQKVTTGRSWIQQISLVHFMLASLRKGRYQSFHEPLILGFRFMFHDISCFVLLMEEIRLTTWNV